MTLEALPFAFRKSYSSFCSQKPLATLPDSLPQRSSKNGERFLLRQESFHEYSSNHRVDSRRDHRLRRRVAPASSIPNIPIISDLLDDWDDDWDDDDDDWDDDWDD